MKEFTDQMNRTIRLEQIPVRIVSLVPSQTEFLHALGLENEVVGITKFCIYPEDWFRSKTRIGGTKQVDIEKVSQLKPDLIIGNKEENTQADIEALEAIAPVWMSDVNSLTDAYEMMHEIGSICNKKERAEKLIGEIKRRFNVLNLPEKRPTALYFIWKNPDYVAGRETFIHAMLEAAGFQNLCTETRYPEWNSAGENQPQPDFVLLSTEPFPFKQEHIAAFQLKFPDSRVLLVSGEHFSWYGSHMLQAPDYFASLQLKKDC